MGGDVNTPVHDATDASDRCLAVLFDLIQHVDG